MHHKAISIAGMMLICIGSTTYMLLARHLAESDPAAISRTLQGFLSEPLMALPCSPSPLQGSRR